MIQVLEILEGYDVFLKSFTGNSRHNPLKLFGRRLVSINGNPKAACAFKKQQIFSSSGIQSVGLG